MGKSLIFGWGINDVDYPVTKIEKIDGKNKQVWVCDYYKDWKHILERSLNKNKHIRNSTYLDCTVCEDWKYLSSYIKFVDSQPNRNWVNCEPDKDLLFVGNKHYSPETVVYVPHNLNSFVLDSRKTRGLYMIGVTYINQPLSKPYMSQCLDPFAKNKTYLGCFQTELEAHKSWQAKKHKYACQLADLQQDPRVAKALRERYAPDKDWTNR